MSSPEPVGAGAPGVDSTDTGGPGDGVGPDGPDGVDWDALRVRAQEAMRHAYAPYSGYPVGAAALVDDGRVVTGCNVENSSYGVTLCAECGLVSALHLSGGGRLTYFVCVDAEAEVITPCGRCRQLLWDHGGPTLTLLTPSGVRTMSQLLPDAFGAHNLG